MDTLGLVKSMIAIRWAAEETRESECKTAANASSRLQMVTTMEPSRPRHSLAARLGARSVQALADVVAADKSGKRTAFSTDRPAAKQRYEETQNWQPPKGKPIRQE